MTDPDAGLIRRFRRGDQAAYEALVRRWDRRVLNLAYRMLGNRHDAQDIRQKVLVRMYGALTGFNGRSALGTWLYRVTVNACRDHLRSRRRRPDVPLAEGYDPPVEPDDAGTATDAVADALDRLDEDHRAVIVLRFLEGMRFVEIARLLDLPESTVKSRARRGLEQLESVLSKETSP